MKKTISIILIITMFATIGIALSACSNISTDKLMESTVPIYEKLIYDVTYSNGETNQVGTYTATIETLQKTSGVEVVDGTEVNFNDAFKLTTSLAIGDTSVETVVLMHKIQHDQLFYPAVSYIEKKVNGTVEKSKKVVYSGSKKSAEISVNENGVNSSSTEEMSGFVFDNTAIYYVLRALPLANGNCNLSFDMPMNPNDLANMTASYVSKTTVANTSLVSLFGTTDIPCYEVTLTRNTRLTGKTYTSYYAENAVKVDGIECKKLPIKMIEADATYSLKEIITTR